MEDGTFHESDFSEFIGFLCKRQKKTKEILWSLNTRSKSVFLKRKRKTNDSVMSRACWKASDTQRAAQKPCVFWFYILN